CEVGLDSRIGRQRFISLLFLLRARRVTGGKTTSTIRISPLLPQSGPNACAQRNETGSPETTSKTLSIATSHQPSPGHRRCRIRRIRILEGADRKRTTPVDPRRGECATAEELGLRQGEERPCLPVAGSRG